MKKNKIVEIVLFLVILLPFYIVADENSPIEAHFEPFGVEENGRYTIYSTDTFPIELTIINNGDNDILAGELNAKLMGPVHEDLSGVLWEITNNEVIPKDGGEVTLIFGDDVKFLKPVEGIITGEFYAVIEYGTTKQLIKENLNVKESESISSITEGSESSSPKEEILKPTLEEPKTTITPQKETKPTTNFITKNKKYLLIGLIILIVLAVGRYGLKMIKRRIRGKKLKKEESFVDTKEMKCPKCNNPLIEEDAFCLECGEKVNFNDKAHPFKLKRKQIFLLLIISFIILLAITSFFIFKDKFKTTEVTPEIEDLNEDDLTKINQHKPNEKCYEQKINGDQDCCVTIKNNDGSFTEDCRVYNSDDQLINQYSVVSA